MGFAKTLAFNFGPNPVRVELYSDQLVRGEG